MDIYSIEKYFQKALSFIQSEIKANRDMYDNTKKRWVRISDTTIEITKAIAQYVRLEQLNDSNPDFNAKDDFVTQDQVQTMIREMLKIPEALVSNYDTVGQAPERFIEDYIRMTNAEVVAIVKNYNRILEKLAKTDCGSSVVNECASMLWRWYEARFIKKYKHVPTFNYDICRIKRVIYNLVVVFGYYHEKGELSRYLETFNSWIHDLGTSPSSHTWIAPHEVYQVEQKMNQVYANLSSVVIWDILLDNGLMELCKMEPNNSVYPRDNELYEMNERVNIDVLDPYVNYKDDASILITLKLSEGGNVND